MPHINRSKEKVAPYLEVAKSKASPSLDKAKPYIGKTIAYIDKAKDKAEPFAKNTLIPFAKKRPIVSSVAVLVAIGAVNSCFNSDEAGIVAIDSSNQGLAGDFEAQERLRRKNKLYCLKVIRNPTHVGLSALTKTPRVDYYFNVSGDTVTPLSPSYSRSNYGLCMKSFKLKNDISTSQNGNIKTERWEIKNGNLVRYETTRLMSSGWGKGAISKWDHPKITKLQLDQYLEKYTNNIMKEENRLSQ
nr:hypothetical protein 8 [bacterium]